MRLSTFFFTLPLGVLAQDFAWVLVGDSTTNNGYSTLTSLATVLIELQDYLELWWMGKRILRVARVWNRLYQHGKEWCFYHLVRDFSLGSLLLTRKASFYANGYWNASMGYVTTAVSQGKKTYVTIQFGHNDQKIAGPEAMAANLVTSTLR